MARIRRFRIERARLPGGNILRKAGPAGTPIIPAQRIENRHLRFMRDHARLAIDIANHVLEEELPRVYIEALAEVGNTQADIADIVNPRRSDASLQRRWQPIAVVAQMVDRMRLIYGRAVDAGAAAGDTIEIEEDFDASHKRRWSANIASIVGQDPAIPDIFAPFLIRQEPEIDPRTRQRWIRINTDLVVKTISDPEIGIVTIPDDHYKRIEEAVTRAVRRGSRPAVLREELRGLPGITRRRADLIARDQITKYNGDMTQERHTKIGITHYTWRTAGDQRVREKHRARQGKRFAYDDPPSETSDDGPPGIPIQCRCWASPDLRGALRASTGPATRTRRTASRRGG